VLILKENTKLIYDVKKMMLAKYPRFAGEMAAMNIEYRTDLPYRTAATDGKNVFVDPEYFASLSDDERIFLIAHEVMHIKFMHMYRLNGKDGNRKDFQLWNEATDAIINANLERDGFTIKEGYVNRPEALQYSSEEFYEILLKEREEQQMQNQQSGQGNSNEEQQESSVEQGQDESQEGSELRGGDHSLWEEAFEKQQQPKDEDKKNDSKSQPDEETQAAEDRAGEKIDEKNEFIKNRKEKVERFKQKREQAERELRGDETSIQLGDVGESKNSIDWRLLLRREIEKSETIWSQRRSIAENNYAYRLEENEIEDEAETEVMIDVSGSVDLGLVKSFLRELKPILRESKLRVGCFNEKFWGMVNIGSERDIDNFRIPMEARGHSAWTEDWDLAVRSFTKKPEINKIVFTDGDPCPGTMPKEDLKRENVVWLVYGNEDFNPCCGKVIQITEQQLAKLQLVEDKSMDR